MEFNKNFTKETLNQLEKLTVGKMDGFNVLVNNYNLVSGKGNAIKLNLSNYSQGIMGYREVVSRLQTQYFMLDKNIESLKDEYSWNEKEVNELSVVNKDIPSIIDNKYSSFALEANSNTFELNYPLDDDYSSFETPFENNDILEFQYNEILKSLNEKLGVRVKNNSFIYNIKYKNNPIRKGFTKVKNSLKKSNSKSRISGDFIGTVIISDNDLGYKISNIEKTKKIIDSILKIAVKKQAKVFTKSNKQKVSQEVLFASRLFADILINRVVDYADIKNNLKVEKCLWLQFANVLNKYKFTNEKLKQITEIGVKSAVVMCDELSISEKEIENKMQKLGYVYKTEPQNKIDAFFAVKQKDFEIYKNNKPLLIGYSVKKNIQPSALKQTKEIAVVNNNKKVAVKTNNVKIGSLEKIIDKINCDTLSLKASKISDKILNKKIANKKIDTAKVQSKIMSLTLSYYYQSVNKKEIKINEADKYSKNEMALAKHFATGLTNRKKLLCDYISKSKIKREEKQSLISYVNTVCQEAFGCNLKTFLTTTIKNSMDIIMDVCEGNSKEEELKKYSEMNFDKETKTYYYDAPNFIFKQENKENVN